MLFMQDDTKIDATGVFDVSFGRAVATARSAQGLSQRALSAKLAGAGVVIDPTVLSRIESGSRPARLSEATALAEALDHELSTLMPEPVSPRLLARMNLARIEGAKNAARAPVRSLLANALAFQALIESEPHLAAGLDSSMMRAPEPGAVLEWLAAYVAYDLEEEFEESSATPLSVDSDERKRAAVAIVEALAAGMLLVGQPPTDQG